MSNEDLKHKTFISIIAITALVVVWIGAACAMESLPVEVQGTARTVKIQCPDDFQMFDALVTFDNTLLLAGLTGPNSYDDMRTAAVLINCGLDGGKLWEVITSPESGNPDSYSYCYRDIKRAENNRVAAMLSGPEDDLTAIQFIENGQVAEKANIAMNLFNDFLPLRDGMLFAGNPDSNSLMIIRANEQGESLWRLIWPERIRINGLATNGNIYAAYGYIDVQSKDGLDVPNESVVIVFDDGGNILWRRDIPAIDRFIDCVWENGKLALAGEFPVTVEQFGDKWIVNNGVVMAFDESGELLFNTEYLYSNDGFTQGFMKSIIQAGAGFIACVDPFPSKDSKGILRMIAVDSSGNITCRWEERFEGMNSFSSVSLASINDQPYLVVNGFIDHAPFPEDDDGNIINKETIPYVTQIKMIALTQSDAES